LSVAGLPGPAPTPVVYDVNVLVMAVADGDSAFRSWPSPPPTSSNRSADCLGIVNDAAEFALWLSPHILSNTGRVLAGVIGMPAEEADEYISILAEIAEASGGGLIDPPQSVGDCPDWEDNRILDLAEAVGAFLIVSDDTDLIAMSPWRGRPIISPDKFAALVDASRRASRRRPSGR
jgi:predicted nucleic acid-binding protein